ncbi:MAG: porin [Alcanivoracaceae bacterium]|jgi:predicted porin|nr:porin [Alcanivoracaceae bacterium]
MRNRYLLPLTLTMTSLCPLNAMAADAQIYGRLHLSADYLNAETGDEGGNLSSNRSRIGFKGTTTISDSLTALWQIEAGIEADDSKTISTDRNTFAGLRGGWGEVRAGRFDTPFKLLHSNTSLFSDQVGDGRNILRADAAYNDPAEADPNWWNERLRNSIAYTSPSWQNLIANVQYSTNQDSGTATSSDQASWSASLEWRYKDLWLAVAHEDSTKLIDVLGGFVAEREAMRAALSWQLGATRLIGIYQQASNPRTDAWGAGLYHAITDKLALKTHFYQLDAAGTAEDAELFAVGVDYTMAKALMFYLNYGQMNNGDSINRDPWTQGRGDALTTGNGDNPDAVSAGAVYRF